MAGDHGLEAASVVIADDHPPARALARRVLEQAGFSVSAEAHDAEHAVRAVLRHRPDVALLDIGMPGDGILAAREINHHAREVAVVMLTVSDDSADVYEALLAGASGYVLKGTETARLPEILRGVLAGEANLPTPLLRRVMEEFEARQRHDRSPLGSVDRLLSEREWEVLELMADGLSTAAIGERLFIAKVTVRSHVAAIVRKLRVEDRESAIALVKARRRKRERDLPDRAARPPEPPVS